jgi:hypothetical protein
MRFADTERVLLGTKAKALGRKALLELDTLVSSDTLGGWHRRLVAQTWEFSNRRGPGSDVLDWSSTVAVRPCHPA